MPILFRRQDIPALVRAAERGVDVRLILPGVSDVPVVKHASRYLYKRYLKHGIRVYEYQRNILHAKTAVIDGIWSTVGSSNLDRRSFRKNLEINVVVLDQEFGDRMEEVFFKDLEYCREVTLETMKKRSLRSFVIQWICYRFRNLL
jgi:cardiolipin synthase